MQAVRVPAVRPYYPTVQVLKALRSLLAGDLTSGEDVRTLEHAFARVMGVPACAAFSGARAGLYHLLKSSGLPADAGVLITPITTAEMVATIWRVGLRPVLVDMDPETLFFDTRALLDAIRGDITAIVLTYLYGLVPPTLHDVIALARERGLLVIEDVSQALGARLRGRALGTLGDAGLASLSSFKVVSSLGGGLVFGTTDRVEACRASADRRRPPPRVPLLVLAAKVLAHRVLTWDPVYAAVFPMIRVLAARAPDLLDRLQTGNLAAIFGREQIPSMDARPVDNDILYTDFQARMALAALTRLHEVNEALRRQAAILASGRGVEARLPARHPDGEHVWWRFPVRAHDARAMMRRLATLGVETSRNALPVCSEIPAFSPYVFQGPLRGARTCHEDYVLVPIHEGHDARAVKAIREALEDAVARDAAPGRSP